MPREKIQPLAYINTLLQNRVRTLTGLLLLLVLAGSLLFGKHWLSDPYRFPLQVVEVKGDFRYLDKQQLKDAMSSHVTGGFFTVDVNTVRTVAEALPWVHKATVRRIWPATLRVTIEEQQAVARWGEQGYLNSKGEAFFPDELVTALQLPWLAGPEGHELNVLERYQQVSRILAKLDMPVIRMELDSRRSWHLQVGEGVDLELGRSDTHARLQRFIVAYPMVFAGRIEQLQRVDLRYSNGFSVFWQLAETPDGRTQG